MSEEQAAILRHHNESRYNECLETLCNGESWTFQEPQMVRANDYDGYEYDREVVIPELMHLRRKVIEQIENNPRAIAFGEHGEWLLFREIPEMEGAWDVLSAAAWSKTYEYLGHGQEREIRHVSNDKVRAQAREIRQWLDKIETNARKTYDAQRELIRGLTNYELDVMEINGEPCTKSALDFELDKAREQAQIARYAYEKANPDFRRTDARDLYWEIYNKERAHTSHYTQARCICSKCGGESSQRWSEREADGCAQDWAVTSRSWRTCLEGCGDSDKRHHIHSSGGSF